MAGIKPIRQGDTKSYRLRLSSNGAPIPANGTLTLSLKVSKEDLDADAALRVQVTRTDDDLVSPDGEMLLQLTAQDTNIPLGSYWFDFEFVSTDGTFVKTILPDPAEEDPNNMKVAVVYQITQQA